VSDFQMVSVSRADSQHLRISEVRVGPRQTHLVRPCEDVLRGQHADGDPPPGWRPRLQHQLDVIQKPVSVAVGAPDVAQAEQPRAAATPRRRSGAPCPRRGSRRGCRSRRHDRQASEPPSPAGGNPRTPWPARAHRRGYPNTVASSADGPADVDHAAAQRSTSLRVITKDRSLLERSERADTTPVSRSRAATAVNRGPILTPVSGATGVGLSGALTRPLTLFMINKAVGVFQYAH
jgi:hypothetical protein